jgi:integrase
MKLTPRHKPYFRLVADGVHIGYRRSTVSGRAGTWLVRRYLSVGDYETANLGTADDSPDMPADGQRVLTFDQAQAAARDWARRRVESVRTEIRLASSPTVRTAIEIYVSARKSRHAEAGRDAELRLAHHVLKAPLAERKLLDLSDTDLARWRAGLKRGGRGNETGKAPLAPGTVARLLNDLRAALTAGARKAKAPAELYTTLKDGLRAPEKPDRAREKQVLRDTDVRRLVECATSHDVDFGALVLVLAATGARMDQVARIRVVDFQPEAERVMIPVSRKGKGEKQINHIAVPLPKDVIARLRSLTSDRPGHEALLMRWHHQQVRGDKASGLLPRWERIGRRRWSDGSSMTRPWRTVVAAAQLSPGLVPYCLRHSSIVRGLRAGLPISLVAAVHDTSAMMIEKHYGAFIVDATEDLLRRAMVSMAQK